MNAEGSHRLVRHLQNNFAHLHTPFHDWLAAKLGPEIGLRDLLDRFSYDCLWRAEARSKIGKSACGVYLPDLEQHRPP